MCKAFTITIIWKINVKPPKTTGWLTPPLGKYRLSLLLLICYSHVDATSFFDSWVHFTPQFIYLRHFYETPLFKIFPQVRFEAPGRMITNSMKQGPGVIPSSQDGHFRSAKA